MAVQAATIFSSLSKSLFVPELFVNNTCAEKLEPILRDAPGWSRCGDTEASLDQRLGTGAPEVRNCETDVDCTQVKEPKIRAPSS